MIPDSELDALERRALDWSWGQAVSNPFIVSPKEVCDLIDEVRRGRKVEAKAAGLFRTASVPPTGEIKVVRQWWDGLFDALGEP